MKSVGIELWELWLWELWTGLVHIAALGDRDYAPDLGGLVVVAAAADGVSHPSHQRQYQADDEEDDPEDQHNMGEGEGRDEAREQEPEDDKDDSENDHDVYLVSLWMFGRRIARVSV